MRSCDVRSGAVMSGDDKSMAGEAGKERRDPSEKPEPYTR